MSILQKITIGDEGNEEVNPRHGKEIEFGLLSFSFSEKKINKPSKNLNGKPQTQNT